LHNGALGEVGVEKFFQQAHVVHPCVMWRRFVYPAHGKYSRTGSHT
jgi:hypothetical protein